MNAEATMWSAMVAGSVNGMSGTDATLNSSIALVNHKALWTPLTMNTVDRQIRAASTSSEKVGSLIGVNGFSPGPAYRIASLKAGDRCEYYHINFH